MTQSGRKYWGRFGGLEISRSVWIVVVTHLVAALWVLSAPGLRTPGYLSALATGFILLVTAPWLGLVLPSPQSLREALRLWAYGTAFLVGCPFVFVSFNALFAPVCAPWLAVGFWVVGPLFGAAMGLGLGMGIRAQKRLGTNAARIITLLMIVGASVIWHLYRIYAEPSVFFYHPIVGYLAGPIYETNPGIGAPFLWHRLWWVGAFFLFFSSWSPRARQWIALSVVWLVLGFSLRGPLGIDAGRAGILEELSEIREGRFIKLNADPGWHRSEDLDRLVYMLDFHVEEISQWLGIPEPSVPTHVFLFRNGGQKRKLMGAGQTEIAKPWLNEIYVKSADPDNLVLRHELAHALAGVLVDSPLNVPLRAGVIPNMPLIEGLATAVAWKPAAFTAHEWTAMAHQLELTTPLDSLLNPLGFWGSYGPLAYTQSASFVEWLRSAYGKAAVQALYSGSSLEEVTGAGVPELESRWVSSCLQPAAHGLPAEAQDLARELLGAKPAFRRPCGLELGRIVRGLFRQAKRGKYGQAALEIERLVEQSGGNPHLRVVAIRLARAALEPAKMVDIAVDLLADPSIQGQLRLAARVGLELADALWWLGSPDAAMGVLSSINTRVLAPPVARAVWVRRFLLGRRAAGDELLLDYLSGRPSSEDPTSLLLAQSIARPEDPIVQYLWGFRLKRRGLDEAAADALERVGAPIHFPPPLIREAGYRSGKYRAFQGKFIKAKQNLALAASFEPSQGYLIALRRWERVITYLEDRM